MEAQIAMFEVTPEQEVESLKKLADETWEKYRQASRMYDQQCMAMLFQEARRLEGLILARTLPPSTTAPARKPDPRQRGLF